MQFVNDNAISTLKIAQDIPKFPVLFNLICELPPTQRGVMVEQLIKLTNTSSNPLVFSIERKYLVAYGMNVLPEKIPRIAHNESFDITIQFTPTIDS